MTEQVSDVIARLSSWITPTSDEERRVKEWLRENYSDDLEGIVAVRDPDRPGNSVRLRLSDPLNLDIMEQVVDRRGFPADEIEWGTGEEGHRYMSYYDVIEVDGERRGKGLEGTFHEIDSFGVEDPRFDTTRLELIAEYLRRRYLESEARHD